MKLKEFINSINHNRRGNPNWFTFTGNVEGKSVRLKACKTWLQIYDVGGIRYGNTMDGSVKQFNIDLMKPFKEESCM